jgi:hypothetical protein
MKHIVQIVAVVVCLGAYSCKAKKGLTKTPGADARDIQDTTFVNTSSCLLANQPACQTMSLRARMSFNDGRSEQAFNATIRWKRDSAIWVSAGLMGFEGARALITQDSFYLMNKLTHELTIKPISYFAQYMPVPATFANVQAILLGQAIDIGSAENRSFSSDSTTVLKQQNNALMQQQIVNRQNCTLQQWLLNDLMVKQAVNTTFTTYETIAAKPFATGRNYHITRGDVVMKLEVEIQKYTINEQLAFPFEINEKYRRIE